MNRRPQRKRRDKRFDPLKAAGHDNRPIRHPWWWKLLHNQKVVSAGILIVGLGMVGGTFFALSGNANTGSQSASNQRTFETATPEPTRTATPDPNASPTPTPSATATPVVRQYPTAPELQIDQGKTYFADIKTDKGTIRVQLFPKEAPQAVNSFVFLAKNGYYDGLTFNRVIPGFIAQAGDAGPSAPGYAVPVEPNGLKHEPGAFVLARNNATGQLSGQFYIALQAMPGQDGKDTVIGKVVSGLQVVDQLQERNPERNPSAAPGDKIQSITISEGPVS